MKDLEGLLREAFRAGGCVLSEDYFAVPKGWQRSLLGLFPVLPRDLDLRNEIAERLVNLPSADLLNLPQQNISPLHYAAALNPSPVITHLVGELGYRRDISLLMEHEWSPVHLQMLGETLRLAKATCIANGVDGRMKIEDSTLLARLLAQIRHLQADTFLFLDAEPTPEERLASTGETIGNEFSRLRLGALRSLAKSQTHLWRNINGNWWHHTISRRGAREESPQARALRGGESIPHDRQYLFTMRLTELEIEENRFDSDADGPVRPYEIDALSCLPRPGDLGRAAWMRILHACAEDRSPEAAVVQFTICAARRISSLSAERISLSKSCAAIQGIITPPAGNLDRNGELHHPASREFTSFAPLELV